MEKPVTLEDLFKRCNSISYIHDDEQDGDWAYEIIDRTCYLYFQPSVSKKDWINNFFFFATPYREMTTKWYCHRGYLRVWKSIKEDIRERVFNAHYPADFDEIVIVGYSHGGSLATLAHEWVWFHFPSLRKRMVGYGFGATRVYCWWFGHMRKKLKERWENFFPVRNSKDIVTHCPFAFLGFRHVNKLIKLDYESSGPIKSHYPEKYENGLDYLNRKVNYAVTLARGAEEAATAEQTAVAADAPPAENSLPN